MVIDGVQLVHYSFHLFIFLVNTVNTTREGRDVSLTSNISGLQYNYFNGDTSKRV